MIGLSSAAPHIGAALGAGLMVLSALAFKAGAGGQQTPELNQPNEIDVAQSNRVEPVSLGTTLTALERTEVVARPDTQLGVAPVNARPPRLAVIIDDIADLATAEAVWALDIPVTIAVLPYSEQAEFIAAQAGPRELFLHMPMEPVGIQDPGPNALTKALADDALEARVIWAIGRVPGAVGFNNHMGSRLTADPDAMEQVFAALEGYQDSLVFVDSLTHPRSVAREVALRAGFKARDRDVFLDHDPARAAIDRQLELALDQAVRSGEAIAIGHPYPQTLAALETLQSSADAAGVEVVTVSTLVRD